MGAIKQTRKQKFSYQKIGVKEKKVVVVKWILVNCILFCHVFSNIF